MRKLALVSLVPLYAGAVAFLYLLGYWGRFDVNFLEFASVTDLVRLSLVPLVTTFLGLPIIYGIQQLLDPMHKWSSLRLPSGARRPPKRWELLVAFLVIVALLAVITLSIKTDKPEFLSLFGSLFGIWLAARLVEDEVRIFPEVPHSAESLLIVVGAALPVLAYSFGSVQSKGIDRPEQQRRDVTSNSGDISVAGYRYLGTLGDFAVFRTTRQTILVTTWDEIGALELPRQVSPAQEPTKKDENPQGGLDSPGYLEPSSM